MHLKIKTRRIRRPLLARGIRLRRVVLSSVHQSLSSCHLPFCPTVLELWDPCQFACSHPPGSSPPPPRTSRITTPGRGSSILEVAIRWQEASKSGPRELKSAPDALQRASRDSKSCHQASKWSQEDPKRPPRAH